MTRTDPIKDESILSALDRLRSSLGVNTFHIVDHWDADLCAIGIAKPDEHSTLVYISTYGQTPGKYYVELETVAEGSNDDEYEVVAEYASIDWDELLETVARHLGVCGTTTL